MNYEPTALAKNPGGDDTLNEHERERGNSAVKSFHLKVRKASLQRFISLESRERGGKKWACVDKLSQLLLRKALWPELFAVPRLFCSLCVQRLSLNLRSL